MDHQQRGNITQLLLIALLLPIDRKVTRRTYKTGWIHKGGGFAEYLSIIHANKLAFIKYVLVSFIKYVLVTQN